MDGPMMISHQISIYNLPLLVRFSLPPLVFLYLPARHSLHLSSPRIFSCRRSSNHVPPRYRESPRRGQPRPVIQWLPCPSPKAHAYCEPRVTVSFSSCSPHRIYPIDDKLASGLFSFASTTLILSLYNAQTRSVKTPNAVVGMACFCGGLAQLLAGMWEFPRGNLFGGTGKSYPPSSFPLSLHNFDPSASANYFARRDFVLRRRVQGQCY